MNSQQPIQKLTLIRPDDWHLHLRDGTMMTGYGECPGTVRWSIMGGFIRGLVMPNLVPPVTTTQMARDYHDRIKTLGGEFFEPFMTLYLTNDTSPEEIRLAAASGLIKAVKLYPANATTNSAAGVTDLSKLNAAVLETMAEVGLILSIHGEVLQGPEGEIDVFHRESRFLSDVLLELVDSYKPRIVLEHITTEDAVRFVLDAPDTVSATITPQHLLENRNAIFRGGINPHNYCLPILKKEKDRQWLLLAATSGNPKFFAGTDSAPHVASRKYTSCGCAGCFTAPMALPLYATAFEQAGALDKLEAFVSQFGAQFYDVPLNTETVTLVRSEQIIPDVYQFDDGKEGMHPRPENSVVPFWAGKTIPWRIDEQFNPFLFSIQK